jgi:hypothetical protein
MQVNKQEPPPEALGNAAGPIPAGLGAWRLDGRIVLPLPSVNHVIVPLKVLRIRIYEKKIGKGTVHRWPYERRTHRLR